MLGLRERVLVNRNAFRLCVSNWEEDGKIGGSWVCEDVGGVLEVLSA